mmetsp:Transcript_117846/g.375686  ORF Transcript_117846/g.375686 Transcript_117846/m.375686 type:complete len:257 (-) Transcript_117846:396-1166(-)
MHLQAARQHVQAGRRELQVLPLLAAQGGLLRGDRRHAEIQVRGEDVAAERQSAREHEVQAEAGGPDVAALAQGVPEQHLRREVVDRSCHRQGTPVLQGARGVEVGQPEVQQVRRDQNVLRLHVSVDDAQSVQVRDCLHQRPKEPSSGLLLEAPPLGLQHRRLHGCTRKALEHQNGAHRIGEEVQGSDDVAVLQGLQDLELLLRLRKEFLVVHSHDFEGHLGSVNLAPRSVDHCSGALAQRHPEVVELAEAVRGALQ